MKELRTKEYICTLWKIKGKQKYIKNKNHSFSQCANIVMFFLSVFFLCTYNTIIPAMGTILPATSKSNVLIILKKKNVAKLN